REVSASASLCHQSRVFPGVYLWLSAFILFLASPVLQVPDSLYSMLTAESLIQRGSPDLSSFLIPGLEIDLQTHSYQMVRVNGKVLYGFGHGSSFLSIPFVAVMDLFGVSPATKDSRFNLRGEMLTQKLLAAILSASMVTVFFCTAALMLPLPWSV